MSLHLTVSGLLTLLAVAWLVFVAMYWNKYKDTTKNDDNKYQHLINLSTSAFQLIVALTALFIVIRHGGSSSASSLL